VIDWLKNKMQQKMLSDQPLQQERRAKRKRNKNDGFCVSGLCFYAVVFWLDFVRGLAALPLRCHFVAVLSTLLPQALHLPER